MKTIEKLLHYVIALLPELVALINHVESDKPLNEEVERQLAMNIIRKAKDLQAKKEIEG